MTTSNTIQKVKYIAFIIVFCAISLSGFSQDNDSINPVLLESFLKKALPVANREVADFDECSDLSEDLKNAQILSIDDLQTLIDSQIDIVLEIEKDICSQMTENEEGELSASVSTGTYSAEVEDMPQIKKGIYFTVSGLVRTMIDLTRPSTDEGYESEEESDDTVVEI